MSYLIHFRTGKLRLYTAKHVKQALLDGTLRPEMLCASANRWRAFFCSRTITFQQISSLPEFSAETKRAGQFESKKSKTQSKCDLLVPSAISRGRLPLGGAVLGMFLGWILSYLLSSPVVRMSYSIVQWPVGGIEAGYLSNITGFMSGGLLIGALLAFIFSKKAERR